MADLRIRNIVIVGGGTAGWMAAAAFARLLQTPDIRIQVIESDAIGIVGVGEATIPQILFFNRFLGIDEDDFVRATQATFKLGIDFVNWGRQGQRYIHPFGPYGMNMEGLPSIISGCDTRNQERRLLFDAYNLQVLAARAGNSSGRRATCPGSPLQTIAYAFHFDAALYAKFFCAPICSGARCGPDRGRDHLRRGNSTRSPASSKAWCWKAARPSRETCSSTAQGSAAC